MALNPEEMKRRRQERQQQRQAQAAKNRRLWIRLAIAAAVLLICGAVILTVSLGGRGQTLPEQTTAAEISGTENAATEGSTEETPKQTVVYLAAAGDLNVTDGVVDSGGLELDYTGTFMDVAHLLAGADISLLNFEGNLVGAPYGTESASAPQALMKALARAGVDMVQLANSYAISHGVSGLGQTIDGVRAAGMEPLGVYADQAAFSAGKGYTIRNVKGIKIAFAAFTKGMDGMALPVGSENCVNVLYKDYSSTYQTVDTERITRVLDAAKAEKPDILVALVHWGSEFNDTISSSQKKIVKLMQSEGVDAIIGTHSHYVQSMQYNQETGQFVAYSLGDFFGDAARSGSEYSVVLNLEITKDNKTKEARITGYSYTPVFTVAEEGKPLRVMRIYETMAAYEGLYLERITQETYAAMQYALTRIEARVTAKVE